MPGRERDAASPGMTMEAARVVEVLHDRGEKASPRWLVGSGFVVRRGIVLTAAHNVGTSEETGPHGTVVRHLSGTEFAASVLVRSEEVDLALLEAPGIQGSAARIGRIDRQQIDVARDVMAAGFPNYKYADRRPDRLTSQPAQAVGSIPTVEDLRGGELTLKVENEPAPAFGVSGSPWEGLSGGGVVVADHLIGVVTEHYLAEGLSSLRVAPLTRIADMPAADRGRFCAILEIGDVAELPIVAATTPNERRLLEAYLEAVVRDFDEDPWTRMAGGRASSLTAIAQRLTIVRWSKTREADRDRDDVAPEDADALASQCKRLVVLGGPGAGKTWLARRTAIHAAEVARTALAGEADLETVEIPLFAECAEVLTTKDAIWDAVVRASVARVAHLLDSGGAREALERRFCERRGRFLIVLDGLDEADYLGADAILDRLAAAVSEKSRIVLTSRPSSWRHQLPLEPEDHRDYVGELQPLRYPDDVTAVIDGWLEGHTDARDRLLGLLRQRDQLAQATRTPLVCAMCCLIAESGSDLPTTRRELYERVITRLLRGTWHGTHLDEQELALARKALRELAWAGAENDQRTGLAAWPDVSTHVFDPPLPARVLAAVNHVAPVAGYDPDVDYPARRFVHSSIREHLVTEFLATRSVAEATALVEPHLWYDVQWEQITPYAVAAHPRRDDLLDSLLYGIEAMAGECGIDARDGFGELRRLLVRLADETLPAAWDEVHADLIDETVRAARESGTPASIVAAGNGWRGAHPGAYEIAQLESGWLPWSSSEIGQWVELLALSSSARERLVASILALFDNPGSPSGYMDWKASLAAVVDALGPTPEQRSAAVETLERQLRDEKGGHHEALALRALTEHCATPGVVEAIVNRFGSLSDSSGSVLGTVFDYAAHDLAATLDVLDADPTARSAAMEHLLDALPEKGSEAHLYRIDTTIRMLRPEPAQLARAIDFLLGRVDRASGSWETAERVRQLEPLLPTDDQAGSVLVHLLEHGGPWSRSDQVRAVLQRLAAHATETDRRTAITAAGRRVAAAVEWNLMQLAEQIRGLDPTMAERKLLVDGLVSRLFETLPERCGFLTSSIRALGANDEQRTRVVKYLLEHLAALDSDDLRLSLCDMAGWFTPKGDERAQAAATLIDLADSVRTNQLGYLRSATAGLALTDDEREEFVDRLTERLGKGAAHDASELVRAVVEVGPTSQQRDAAARLLMARLERDRPRDLDRIVTALQTIDAASGWQARASGLVRDAILRASPEGSPYYVWSHLLGQLPLSSDDRHQLVDALLLHLGDPAVDTDALLHLLDSLGPTAEQTDAINDLLLDLLTSCSDDVAPRFASTVLLRRLDAVRGRAAVEALLTRLDGADVYVQSDLLKAVADFKPDSDQLREAVGAAVGLLAWSIDRDNALEDDEEETDERELEDLRGALYSTLAELSGLDEAAKELVRAAVLDDIVRDASVGEETLPLLMQFGFDGAALKDFADVCSLYVDDDEFDAEVILRTLAAGLRRVTDVETWQKSLREWAHVHPTLYGTD
jgi:hypothetical protein